MSRPHPDRESSAAPGEPPSTPTSVPDLVGGTAPAPPGPAAPDFSFLAPPQSAGELGGLGPYRVLAVLGKGGMGTVFRAHDPGLGRQIALKVMLPQLAADPEARQRFAREARAQAAVEHDHIIPIFCVGEDRGTPYIAMPLLKGMTLAAALRANPRPPVAEVVRVGRQVAEGLAAAHDAGLIHRDVKPSNVWLEGGRRRVKILDFGLARAADRPADPDDPTTESGAILGTASYMSPEQAQSRPLDARADLFSLGVVLYQMATGRLPFTAPTNMSVLLAVVNHHPPAPADLVPELPRPLSDLIVRLLAKDPAHRPPSAAAVAEDLRQIGRGLAAAVPAVAAIPLDPADSPDPWAELASTDPHEVVHTSPTPRPRDGGWAVRWAWAGAAAAGLTLVVGLAWAAYRLLTPPDSQPSVRADERKPPAVVPPKDRPAAAPEQRLAEWVFRHGGSLGVRVGDKDLTVSAPEQLPALPFRITAVVVGGGSIGDPELEHFRDAPGVQTLKLLNTAVTDVGLARLAGFPGPAQLEQLITVGAKLTDAGLESVKRFQSLGHLDVTNCPGIAGPGLKHLRDLPQLSFLNLNGTGLRDSGLVHLAGIRNLNHLFLSGTKITDDGLKHLADVSGVAVLQLESTDVGDEGLAHLKGSTRLRHLVLAHTKVGDAGLKHLAGNRDLEYLNLCGTKVTDAGMETVAGFKKLKRLLLAGLPITPDGLAKIAGLTELDELNLDSTQVGDAGLVHLRGLPRLAHLDLTEAGVTDAGLATLAELRELNVLLLRKNKVTEAGVKTLAAALPKCRIEWDGPTIEPKN